MEKFGSVVPTARGSSHPSREAFVGLYYRRVLKSYYPSRSPGTC
jgi:hypothetical protein